MMEDFTMEFKENTDFDLIGLGEVMLRLSPPNKEKISQSETFEKMRAEVNLTLYRVRQCSVFVRR